jgi:hypothetical protein
MLTRKSLLIIASGLVATVTFGCGGGSDAPTTPAAGTLSRMVAGDSYTFAIKGSSKFPTGSFSYTGTAVLGITDNVTLGSKTGLVKLTATTDMKVNGQ